jgi:hypothetical protein
MGFLAVVSHPQTTAIFKNFSNLCKLDISRTQLPF